MCVRSAEILIDFVSGEAIRKRENNDERVKKNINYNVVAAGLARHHDIYGCWPVGAVREASVSDINSDLIGSR